GSPYALAAVLIPVPRPDMVDDVAHGASGVWPQTGEQAGHQQSSPAGFAQHAPRSSHRVEGCYGLEELTHPAVALRLLLELLGHAEDLDGGRADFVRALPLPGRNQQRHAADLPVQPVQPLEAGPIDHLL